MPLNIPDELPAFDILSSENIFVINETRALHQDIRPMRIAILNLMPVKITTETHLLRVLSNTPLQIEITLLHTADHVSSHTPKEHLKKFYQTFEEVKHKKFDGLIITGAPIEHLEFEEVDYWNELERIMEWSKKNVTSTLYICWAAQAGLYYHYKIPKYPLTEKMFGVFKHTVNHRKVNIVRGFDDVFLAPHSRYTEVKREDIEKVSDLEILSESEEAGIYIVGAKNGRQFFVTGHSEYDPETLKLEYMRDQDKGIGTKIPKNYFKNDNPINEPLVRWKSHANLLYSNWLNYYVYQMTPYDIDKIE